MTFEWKVPENLQYRGMTHEWKVPQTYSNVAWRVSGKFKRIYSSHRETCPSSASSHERFTCPNPPHPTRAYMHLPAATDKHVLPPQVHMNVLHAPTHPTPPVHTCTYRQPQTSMSFLRKFTWTLLHAPPPTPPHPPDVYKTPRPSKGRGPTKCYLFFEMFKSEKQAIIKTCDLNNTNEHLSLQIMVLSATNYHISWADFRGSPGYEQIILPLYIVKLCHAWSSIFVCLMAHSRISRAQWALAAQSQKAGKIARFVLTIFNRCRFNSAWCLLYSLNTI